MRYLNHVMAERIMKTTETSPLKMNIDWPNMK
jgi:hypothetical protein